MNASITKMQIFDDMKFDLIIITLTYVLMDNFCPCFFFRYSYIHRVNWRISYLHWRYLRGEFSAPQNCSASGAYQTRGESEYLIIDKILVFTFAPYAPHESFFVEGRNILFRISSGSYSPRLDIFLGGEEGD